MRFGPILVFYGCSAALACGINRLSQRDRVRNGEPGFYEVKASYPRGIASRGLTNVAACSFCEANGSYGQYLVIYPDQRLVAVRMMVVTEKTNPATDSFENFPVLVRALVPSA
jgi:hypothetical protein